MPQILLLSVCISVLHLGNMIVLHIDPVDRGWIEAVPPEYVTTTTFKTIVVLTNL